MKRAFAFCALLCVPAAAFAQPQDVGGSWKVPGRTGGVVGTVRLSHTDTPNHYDATFILGDGSVKRFDARFDGEVLTVTRGGDATTTASVRRGAVGVLDGASDDGDATSAAASARVGTYTFTRAWMTIDGRRQRAYRFSARGDVHRDGPMPVQSFARVATQIRITGPSILRYGQRASYSAQVYPSGVRGSLSWSVRGAYVHWFRENDQVNVQARETGLLRVYCRFTPDSGAEGAQYETTHYVEIKPVFESIKVKSLTFESDHGVLKDHDANWNDGGSRFAEPEWTAARQHPITHTLGRRVRVKVTLEVTPGNAPPFEAYLRGDGPGAVDFRKSVMLRGGRQTVSLRSVADLPRSIEELDLDIAWRYTMRDTAEGPEIGTTHTKAFLTMGRPRSNDRQPGVTLKRMRQAVKAITGARSLDPHAIAKHVIGKWSHFNLDVAYFNAWELGDDREDPVTGKLVGADCQTIVRYTENVIRIAGVPGKSEFIVVWAKVKKPTKAIAGPREDGHMGRPRQFHNDHFRSRSSRRGWVAYLIDGNNRPNNYEAALRFTHGGQKLYYPGGVQAVMSDADAVLRVFQSMSWVDTRDGNKVKTAIVRY